MKKMSEQLAGKIQCAERKSRGARPGICGAAPGGGFCRGAFRCFGIDADKSKVRELNAGISYIPDIPSVKIKAQLSAKTFAPTFDFSKISLADAVLVCVPTPLGKSKDPDFSFVLNAVDAISPRLKRGQLIIIESTIYPGMTIELIGPRLFEQTGLKPGKDFFLAMSPERIDPGNKKFALRNTPKVVGGIDAASTKLTSELYQADRHQKLCR